MTAMWKRVLAILSISAAALAQEKPPVAIPPPQDQVVIDEAKIVALVDGQSPQTLQLNKALLDAEYDLLNLKENYQWNWVTELNHVNSNEEGIASFMPTFGPTYFLSTGVQKNFAGGVGMKANVFTDQQSTTDGGIDKATRTGAALQLSVDLWKNLFGRVDKAELQDQKLVLEKQKLQNEIDRRAVELELRKLYWSLVANQEQQTITSGLLKTSETQLQDGIRRGRQHIADKGEIARLRAQVEERQSTLESLQAQRDLLIQSLKEQLPALAEQTVVLGPYDIESKVQQVVACTKDMIRRREVPWDYTKADEVIALLEKSYQQKQQISRRYSDVDVKLESSLRVSGVDRGYGNSFDEFSDNGRSGYSVGVVVAVPLGSTQDKAKAAKEKADLLAFQADKLTLLAKAKAQHTQIVSLVMLLQSSLHSMEQNTAALRESISSSEQKFRQARISLNDLMAEQDALLNSLLREIDTKLNVVHILLNYFKVFTDDPCSLNKVTTNRPLDKVGV